MADTEQQFESFLRHLAERRGRENDLSDVLWAMAQVVYPLRESLCRLFDFPVTSDERIELYREQSLPTGRPDFLVETTASKLLIEVKLEDRNYHFQEYAEAARQLEASLGLLTNHRLSPAALDQATRLRWKVRAWEELVRDLEAQDFAEATPLVESLLAFMKRVCNMREMRNMRFTSDTLYSLPVLVTVLKKVIESAEQRGYVCHVYPRQERAFGETWTGVIYQLVATVSGGKAWPFFGVVYEKPGDVRLVTALDEDWNRELVRSLRQRKIELLERFDTQDYADGTGLNVVVSEPVFGKLSTSNLDAQRQELQRIFEEVNQALAMRLDEINKPKTDLLHDETVRQ